MGMSRSRRRRKLPKCICGAHRLKVDDAKPRARLGNCDVLDYVTEHNERLRSFRQRRALPLL